VPVLLGGLQGGALLVEVLPATHVIELLSVGLIALPPGHRP
jgi:hypothetical protein